MIYVVEIAPEGAQDLRDLHAADRRLYNRVVAKIQSLAADPTQGKPLRHGLAGKRSLRVGDRRIVYVADSLKEAVIVLTVKHRGKVYG